MDYDKVAQEIIRALRGRRSQRALSRRLGYQTNVVYSWESGRRAPTAAETLRAISRVGLDVRVGITEFLKAPMEELERPRLRWDELVVAILREVRGDSPIAEFARNVGLGRSSVSRWLSGDAYPRLPTFLQLLGYRALDFVAPFVDPATLPSAEKDWAQQSARRDLAYGNPNTELVVLALDLEPYRRLERHDLGVVARLAGITEEEAQGALDALKRAGAIEWRGRRYASLETLTVAMDQDPARLLALKQHWAGLAGQRLDDPTPEDRFSYAVFAASDAAFERIRSAHSRYVEQLIQILASDEGETRLGLVNVQLVALGAARVRSTCKR